MKYSRETLKKVIASLDALIRYFISLPYEMLRLHISKGNRKIGRAFNFSTAPVITCGNCKHCKGYCYDIKACWQYKNVRTARAENTAMMIKDQDATFAKIDEFISKNHKRKFFRWHVAGEITSLSYLSGMIFIAKRHPEWRFWTYTKMFDLVNQYCDDHGGKEVIPENLTIMFSAWKGMRMNNKYNFPVFVCIMPGEEIPTDAIKCPGNCDICIENKTGCVYGKSAYNHLH